MASGIANTRKVKAAKLIRFHEQLISFSKVTTLSARARLHCVQSLRNQRYQHFIPSWLLIEGEFCTVYGIQSETRNKTG